MYLSTTIFYRLPVGEKIAARYTLHNRRPGSVYGATARLGAVDRGEVAQGVEIPDDRATIGPDTSRCSSRGFSAGGLRRAPSEHFAERWVRFRFPPRVGPLLSSESVASFSQKLSAFSLHSSVVRLPYSSASPEGREFGSGGVALGPLFVRRNPLHSLLPHPNVPSIHQYIVSLNCSLITGG